MAYPDRLPAWFCDLRVSDIIKLGGWSTDHVMKTVYRHSMIEKEKNAKREAASKLSAKLFS